MSAKPWIITVSVCGFVTAALAGIKFMQISQAMALMENFPPSYETVTVASAEADEWQPTRLLSGTVQSPEHLVISAETPGRIVELPYQSGEAVPAGAEPGQHGSTRWKRKHGAAVRGTGGQCRGSTLSP